MDLLAYKNKAEHAQMIHSRFGTRGITVLAKREERKSSGT